MVTIIALARKFDLRGSVCRAWQVDHLYIKSSLSSINESMMEENCSRKILTAKMEKEIAFGHKITVA